MLLQSIRTGERLGDVNLGQNPELQPVQVHRSIRRKNGCAAIVIDEGKSVSSRHRRTRSVSIDLDNANRSVLLVGVSHLHSREFARELFQESGFVFQKKATVGSHQQVSTHQIGFTRFTQALVVPFASGGHQARNFVQGNLNRHHADHLRALHDGHCEK